MCVLQALVATWVKNVGRVRKTLHWASEPFYFYLHGMLSMSLQDVQAEFKQGSRMDGLSKGVMEVMFWVSCFQPPVVVALGDCFWDLARELIRLQVSNVDQLNYLFWGGLIPQTVIVLEAREYQMDSMIPPIKADISIEGCVCPVEHTNLSEEHVQEDETRTVLRISSHSSLIFTGSVRLLNLTVSQSEMSSVHTLSEVSMKFIGLEPDHATIVMDGVKMCSAGCSVSNYSKVNCNHFSVTGAMAGFIGYNIKSLHMAGSQTHLENPSFKTGFFFCDTAMLLRDVTSFIVTKQTFYENNVVFDMRVRAVCIVEDSVIARCDHMGEIMTSVNCHPTFIRVVVSYCALSLIRFDSFETNFHFVCRLILLYLIWLKERSSPARSMRLFLFPILSSVSSVHHFIPKKFETFHGLSCPLPRCLGSPSFLYGTVEYVFPYPCELSWSEPSSEILVSQIKDQQIKNGA